MVKIDECTISTHFYGIRKLLLALCQRIFKDRKSNYRIVKEEQEIHMVREVCGNISEA
jgi:hypothetical protein